MGIATLVYTVFKFYIMCSLRIEIRTCKDCKVTGDRTLFPNGKGLRCRKCTCNLSKNKYISIKVTTPEETAKRRRDARKKDWIRSKVARNSKQSAKVAGIPYDVSVGYLKRIWQSQNGKCFWSGLEFADPNAVKGVNLLAPSIDLLDRQLGFVEGNIIFAAYSVRMKRRSVSELEFKRYLAKIEKKEIVIEPVNIAFKASKRVKWMQETILHGSKANAPNRGLEHTITLDDLWRQWDLQNGKCYWLGVEMGDPSHLPARHPMMATIDRLDPKKGYIPGNFVFATFFANMGRSNCEHDEFKRIVDQIFIS